MAQKLSKSNQSIEKVLFIIEIMANESGPMRLQDIAERAGIPASTTLRLVNTLLRHGYAHQDAYSQRYHLSLKFMQIGNKIHNQISLRGIARPFLLELAQRCQEASCLAVDHNMEVVYTDVVEGPDNMLKIMQHIGKRAPMHCTGVGKLMLLNYNEEKLDNFIQSKGLPVLTPYTKVTKAALLADLENCREQDYALDDEECEIGARCVAGPIRDYTGKIIAAISVSGPTSRLTLERTPAIIAVVKEIAARISQQMAFEERPPKD
ncbi:MAG: IclR family transcriptional regulator [Saccharofermentanales bacterium]|nr:IclR family transcriptional regulator [Clostridiaceae bacterium]